MARSGGCDYRKAAMPGKLKKNLIIGVAAFLVLTGTHLGAWLHGNNHGKVTQINQHYEELEVLRGKLSKQKKQSSEIIAQQEAILREEMKKSHDKINRLLQENQAFRDWWNQSVPCDAVELAYGVRACGSSDGL